MFAIKMACCNNKEGASGNRNRDPMEALEAQDIFSSVEQHQTLGANPEDSDDDIDKLVRVLKKYNHGDIRVALSNTCPEWHVKMMGETMPAMPKELPQEMSPEEENATKGASGLKLAPPEAEPDDAGENDTGEKEQEGVGYYRTRSCTVGPQMGRGLSVTGAPADADFGSFHKRTTIDEEEREADIKVGRHNSILNPMGPEAEEPITPKSTFTDAKDTDPAPEVVFGRRTSVVSKIIQGTGANRATMKASALGQSKPVQFLIHSIALGGVLFVLVAAATGIGASDGSSACGSAEGSSADGSSARLLGGSAEGSSACGSSAEGSSGDGRLLTEGIASFIRSVTGAWDVSMFDDHSRRLGGAVSPLMYSITFAVVGAGLLALFLNVLGQPLILGYLLGGFLVGPFGLDIVASHTEIETMANLGLVFLLFMIGLELNLFELFKMGKVIIMSGLLQFPVCALVHTLLFSAFGSNFFGNGKYATLYCGLACAISSSMLVVQLLSEKLESDSEPGRLTVGILLFQNLWVVFLLAMQPNMSNPGENFKSFIMVGVVLLFACAYAKFVMPVVFLKASKSVELMLVMALSWCFFIGSFAMLPFIGLSLELAALVAGVVLASFPYSAEFNGKIKYLRDFFVTLFFVAMGMQCQYFTGEAIGKACVLVIVVLAVRWLGICGVVYLAGGGTKLASLATLNLSQLSEVSLVLVSLGVSFGHLEEDTLAIMVWAFAILAIATQYLVTLKHKIYAVLLKLTERFREADHAKDLVAISAYQDRDVVLLGFHRIASMLVSVFEQKAPAVLAKINVIETNQSIKMKLREKGVMYSYGDISSATVLEHAHLGQARLVISTIPDSLLKGMDNKLIVTEAKKVWPKATIMAVAENHNQLKDLYKAGADYVLHMPRLCAERIENLLGPYMKGVFQEGELKTLLDRHAQVAKEGKKEIETN